jgi:hypothetical protein
MPKAAPCAGDHKTCLLTLAPSGPATNERGLMPWVRRSNEIGQFVDLLLSLFEIIGFRLFMDQAATLPKST